MQDRKWKNVKPGHEKLWIWQKAHGLYIEICRICKTLPRQETFQLRSQMERSAQSVMANIAEGNESYYFDDKKKGLFIARKEAAETQNHLRVLEAKKYWSPSRVQDMIDQYEEVKRGINGMIRTISSKKDIYGRKGSKRR